MEWRQHRLTLSVRPNTPRERRAEILEAWYRAQLRAAAEPLVELWQTRLDVRLTSLFVRRMRTRWGSCNPTAGTIRLNTDLAKKPADCLEYIIVHELAHLIEPTHNAGFVAAMDRFLPGWVHRRELLNRLPVRHDDGSTEATAGQDRGPCPPSSAPAAGVVELAPPQPLSLEFGERFRASPDRTQWQQRMPTVGGILNRAAAGVGSVLGGVSGPRNGRRARNEWRRDLRAPAALEARRLADVAPARRDGAGDPCDRRARGTSTRPRKRRLTAPIARLAPHRGTRPPATCPARWSAAIAGACLFGPVAGMLFTALLVIGATRRTASTVSANRPTSCYVREEPPGEERARVVGESIRRAWTMKSEPVACASRLNDPVKPPPKRVEDASALKALFAGEGTQPDL